MRTQKTSISAVLCRPDAQQWLAGCQQQVHTTMTHLQKHFTENAHLYPVTASF